MMHDILPQLQFSERRWLDTPANDNLITDEADIWASVIGAIAAVVFVCLSGWLAVKAFAAVCGLIGTVL